MVTVAHLGRSIRGASAILNRRPDALDLFEVSEAAFWRSFAAIGLTAPVYVVELALIRHRCGLPGADLFDRPGLALLVAVGHLLGFLALPAAMIGSTRNSPLAGRSASFVIVTNWLAVLGAFALALPSGLLLMGLETPALTAFFTATFAALLAFAQWHAARVTLGTGATVAAAVSLFGYALSGLSGALVQALAPAFAG